MQFSGFMGVASYLLVCVTFTQQPKLVEKVVMCKCSEIC